MGPTVIPRTGGFRSHAPRAPTPRSSRATAMASREPATQLRMRSQSPTVNLVDEGLADVGDARHHGVGAGLEQACLRVRLRDGNARAPRGFGRFDAGEGVFDDEGAPRSLDPDSGRQRVDAELVTHR